LINANDSEGNQCVVNQNANSIGFPAKLQSIRNHKNLQRQQKPIWVNQNPSKCLALKQFLIDGGGVIVKELLHNRIKPKSMILQARVVR